MKKKTNLAIAASAVLAIASCASPEHQSGNPMTFFVTSAGSGKGADLGGLAGADRLCQSRAEAAGAGGKTWHAYLSTTASGGQGTVNARDRIGRGPWQNAKGVVIARSVADLHSNNNNLTKQTALTEKGDMNPGRGDPVNEHDILTGSSPDGRAMPGSNDTTCANWTSSSSGSAILGHADRQGLRDDEASRSWNSSHPSKGCSQQNLVSTGGAGKLYCFAVN
jgi:hypothetical protein